MRIVKSSLDPRRDQSDVQGEHTVVYPISSHEVVQALKFAETLGVKPLIRSGLNASYDEKVDGKDIVVVQLRDLDEIKVKGSEVIVGAGATTSELASCLVAKKLFLPLDENADKSIVSNVLSSDQGDIGRSAGLLRQYVRSFVYVTAKGGISTAAPGEDRPADSVITHIVFNAKNEDEVKNLVLSTKAAPYIKKELRKLLDGLFVSDETAQLRSTLGLDLTVRVFTGAFGVPIVGVAAACATTNTLTNTSTFTNTLHPVMDKIGGANGLLYSAELYGENDFEGIEVVKAVAEQGSTITLRYQERRRQYASDQPFGPELSSFLDQFCERVDKALKVSNPFVRVTSTFRLQDKGVRVMTSLYMHGDKTDDETELLQEFEDHAPAVGPTPKADSVLAPIAIASANFVAEANASGIPNLKGEVFYRGDPAYNKQREQYATSSYENEASRMMPNLIAYPEDTADVIAIVEHAIKDRKKVVARSGGHQYCGMSSGGDDTIQISMKLMNSLPRRPTGEHENVISVGPGARLTDLSDLLRNNRLTIPHGECPLVAIGGHVQTGGFGHTLRSFGLCLDYVKSFEIVLANENGEVSSRRITRPSSKVDPDDRRDDNLNNRMYWGVLGGGPGSFGIITDLEFECVRDSDHPNSVGYSAIYKYRKYTFKSCMDIVMEFTAGIEDGTLPADYDLMISTMNGLGPNTSRPFDPILVEMLHGNLGGAGQRVSTKVFDKYIRRIRSFERLPQIWEFGFRGRRTLSFMVESWVRKGGMDSQGREFSLPYKKRVNATKNSLTEAFLSGFVDLVDETIQDDHVKLVFQMVLGGGAYKSKGEDGITSIPHRDTVIGIVYDCFYEEGYETRAEELQGKMQALLREFQDYDETDPEGIRMIWGSFGDTDMNTVWKNYYGVDGPYKQLQKLKADADPLNIFTNSFTVQMPRGIKRARES